MKTRNPISLMVAAVISTAPVTAQSQQLEEVLVTAQKRVESAQDVPIALTAVSGSMIDAMGITQTQDLTKLSPSLTARTAGSKQNSSFSLRGIGTQVYSIGVEQSVAVIVDDVSTVQAGQSIGNLVDIQRVEILRGPQSTLFGKSASAGVISVVTKPPAEELEGSIEVTLTDEQEQRVLGSISGPLSDTIGYRLTGHWSDRDGYMNNLTSGEDLNEAKSKGMRGKFQWDISDTLEVHLTAYYSKDESTCCAASWQDLDSEASFFGVVPGELAPGITPSDDNLDVRADTPNSDETENKGINFRLNADLNEFNLVSITAGDEWEYSNFADVDLSDVDIQGFFTGGLESGGVFNDSQVKTEFFSQEFRLTSPSYDKFDYLLGLYYADAETERTIVRNTPLSLNWTGTSGTESIALFGQANWRFSEATTLTAGLRWNDEEITADFLNSLLDPAVNTKGKEDDSVVLGNVSLQHFFLEDAMIYARYAQGYKGQAFNITGVFDEFLAANPAPPETSDSFEIGFKSTLLDNRLQFNAVAFYTEYKDFQASSLTLDENGVPRATLDSVGDTESQGVELESVALIGENLTLTVNAAYIDATIASYEDATCYAGQDKETGCIDGVQDLGGADLPLSPKWKWNLVADYRLELASMPFYGFMNLSYVWQDEAQFRLDNNPLTIHDSYGVGDFSFGINERDDDRYRVTLFVKNFADENYRSNLSDFRALFGGTSAMTQVFPRNSQRYFGVRAKYNF